TTVVGGNSIGVTVALSGAAPITGAGITLTSSNPAVIPATNLTIGSLATSQTFNVATMTVTTPAAVILTASYNGSSAVSPFITVNPSSQTSATGAATFLNADLTTQGSWKGVYGGDGFAIIGDTVNYPSYVNVTPSGASLYAWPGPTG